MPDNALSALVPQQERVIEFYGDPIPVASGPEGELYVPVRPICEFLGLDFSAQRQRIQRHPSLARGVIPVLMQGADNRRREMLALPLRLLPGWLFGVEVSRV